MEKSVINLNYKIEVLHKKLTKEEVLKSIQLVSNNPELLISNRIKSDVSIENHGNNLSNSDAIYVDYFRFFKKN